MPGTTATERSHSWSEGGAENVEIVDYHWEGPMATEVIMPPVHPGEILLREFLEPLGLSQYQLARSIAVPARRINEIVHSERRISADTALRLSRFFGTSERFWMTCRHATTWKSKRAAWARRSTTSSRTPPPVRHGRAASRGQAARKEPQYAK